MRLCRPPDATEDDEDDDKHIKMMAFVSSFLNHPLSVVQFLIVSSGGEGADSDCVTKINNISKRFQGEPANPFKIR